MNIVKSIFCKLLYHVVTEEHCKNECVMKKNFYKRKECPYKIECEAKDE
jgi:hypothetical protein